jgi:hypothetical protein
MTAVEIVFAIILFVNFCLMLINIGEWERTLKYLKEVDRAFEAHIKLHNRALELVDKEAALIAADEAALAAFIAARGRAPRNVQ